MSDYPMLISNKLHSFRNFRVQRYKNSAKSFCVAAKNGINMRILTKMSCSYSDNRLIFPL